MWTEANCLPTRCSTTEYPWALQTYSHINNNNNNNKKMRYKNKERIEMTRDRRVSKWERTKRDRTNEQNQREKNRPNKNKMTNKANRNETNRIDANPIRFFKNKNRMAKWPWDDCLGKYTHDNARAQHFMPTLKNIPCNDPMGRVQGSKWNWKWARKRSSIERAGVCQVMPSKI